MILNDNYNAFYERIIKKASLVEVVEINQHVAKVILSIDEPQRFK